MDICPPVAILPGQNSTHTPVRKTGTTSDFCLEALQEALGKYGKPEIFNTDQGSQFTCGEWIDTLKAAGVQISMDGKGRWIDNVFIERLWRSVKYENIYLRAYETGTQLRRGLTGVAPLVRTEILPG